jgi:hypothetical protein
MCVVLIGIVFRIAHVTEKHPEAVKMQTEDRLLDEPGHKFR